MNLIKDLGNGLTLRRASKEDAQALAEFNGLIHGEDADHPDRRVAAWTRDLLTLPHPTLRPEDFTIIEETAAKRIVSSLNLIPQTWTYDGVEFGVGRPELVGTLPEYRGRGLVRAQFDEIHKWCEERNYPVQAITGIPYFYRQFGYEMAMNLGGRRSGFEPHVPVLKDGKTEAYAIRPATESDLEFIASVYDAAQARYAIACKRSPEIWRHELNGQSAENINRFPMYVIEDLDGGRVGYFHVLNSLVAGGILAGNYEIKPGASWLDVTPGVVRHLWKLGQEMAAREAGKLTSFGFLLGEWHPVYEVLGNSLPFVRDPYAYYLRVPNLPAFLNHIKPALEKRLAESAAVGFSGEVKVGDYRTGFRMSFERGRLAGVESYDPKTGDKEDALFPGLAFLQMLFGHRTFDELRRAHADCMWNNNEARVVLNALFPKRLSDVLPVY